MIIIKMEENKIYNKVYFVANELDLILNRLSRKHIYGLKNNKLLPGLDK
jgi:hypothetical protein